MSIESDVLGAQKSERCILINGVTWYVIEPWYRIWKIRKTFVFDRHVYDGLLEIYYFFSYAWRKATTTYDRSEAIAVKAVLRFADPDSVRLSKSEREMEIHYREES